MKRALFFFAVLALGCTDPGAVPPDQALTLSQCPADAGPCELVGDGLSQVTVGICVPSAIDVPAAGLQATLLLSEGAWVNPPTSSTPQSYLAELTNEPCAYPRFTVPATLGPVHIDAQLEGYSQSLDIPLSAAQIGSIELVPSGVVAMDADLAIAATVTTTTGGTPTLGTTLAFSIVPDSTGVVAGTVYPATTVLDGGTATAQLLVQGTPSAVTVKVTATPPSTPGGSSTATVTIPN